MEQSINVNFENLTEEERKALLELCKKSQKKEGKEGLWIPNEGQIYYSVTDYGTISSISFSINNPYDEWRIIDNNCFKTEEEAEFELEKRKILYELRKFAAENNTEEIDWNNISQDKYFFHYDYEDKHMDIDIARSVREFNNICFTSKHICDQAIEQIGKDRIKKYLFNVRE